MIVFWHPTLDQAIASNHFDWGDAPQTSSADKTFRVKNTSAEEDALSVTFTFDTDPDPSIVDDFLVSRDGSLFEATAILNDGLDAGEVSDVLTVRRNTPSDSPFGAWAVDIIATPEGFADDVAATATEAMDVTVTTDFPVPHIWFLSPDSEDAGYSGSFRVVGQGFGATQGQSRIWWARGTNNQRIIETVSWERVEATYATAAERLIDAEDIEATNVAYDVIRTSVPNAQPRGTYDVTVETDDADEVVAPDVDGGDAMTTTFDDDLDGGSASATLTSSVNGGGA